MSVRKHAYVCILTSDKKVRGRVVRFSWTTRAERNAAVKRETLKWAKNFWKNQSAVVEISTLDGPTGGLIMINGETEPCCQFWLEEYVPAPPPPVSALFAAGGQ